MNLRQLVIGTARLVALCWIGTAVSGQVIITEFLASNRNGLSDEDGEASDWIELNNPSASPVDLGGWSLTDDPDDLAKWRFPQISLPPDRYLVVFASGKNRAMAGRELHTSFSLSADGEYLALVKPDGRTIATQFAPEYPAQRPDISYGVAQEALRIFLVPSGAAGKVFIPTRDVGAEWNQPGFDESAWFAAPTGLGFGTSYASLIGTDLADRMLGEGSSVYVRLPFVVADPSALASLKLRMWFDDGFAAFLNGAAIVRSNAPADLRWDSAAVAAHEPASQSARKEDFEWMAGAYTLTQQGAGTPPAVQAPDAGSDGKFLRLVYDGTVAQANGLAFDQVAPGLSETIITEFDFRCTSVDTPGDGIGVLLLPTTLYGAQGPGIVAGASVSVERPNFPNIFGVGFDVTPHATVNDVSVHWNGAEVHRVTVPKEQADLTAGVFHHVRIRVTRTTRGTETTIVLTPNIRGATPGSPSILVNSMIVPGLNLYECRVQLAARTTSVNMNVDIDNVSIQHLPAAVAFAPDEFDLSEWVSRLRAGTNVLAVQGLNAGVSDPDFLLAPELVAQSKESTESIRFFAGPTPGRANSATDFGLAAEPVFAQPGGFYTNALAVELGRASSDTVIRYTVNGSDPTASSPIYTTPIPVTRSLVIRAKAYRPGYSPSLPVAQTYTLVAASLADFSSNLPLIVIHPYGRGIVENVKTPVYFDVLDRAGGRSDFRRVPEVGSRAGIEIRGSSSLGFPKHSYTVEIDDENGEDRSVSLLGMPEESDWILYAPYTEKTLMRDVLAYELSNRMGRYAPRTRFVELFVNFGDSRLDMTDYQGVYVLVEKIKRNEDRVDIARLGTGDNAEPEVSGGYILKKDRLDPGDNGFSTQSGQLLGYVEPKEQEITLAQRSWLRNYLNKFETALYGANFKDPLLGYAPYIDVGAFLDHHWMVELAKNIDGYRLSTFMHKDRGGKLKMGPLWDYNLSFGNANYLEGWTAQGWYYTQVGDDGYPWYRRLFQDPDFNQQYIDRWAALRRDEFRTDEVLRLVDEMAAALEEAQVRNFQRWPILGTYIWPNWYIGRTYRDEVIWMREWIEDRLNWIDSGFISPPVFSAPGGRIAPGAQLRLTASRGEIYYTTTGSDPRASGGGIAAGAKVYSGPLVLTSNARVAARARVSGSWSGPTAETYYTELPGIILSEIMYHPVKPAAGSAYPADDFEFIELKNAGNVEVNLSGFSFKNGIEYTFPSNSPRLSSGARVVVAKNPQAFATRYGSGTGVLGPYWGSLENAGERLTLKGSLQEPVLDFEFDDSWHPATDGFGFSLVPNSEAQGLDWSEKENWRASSNAGGSPGAPDAVSGLARVLVTEVLTHTDPPQVDSIELYNPGPGVAEIGDWLVTDNRGTPWKYRILPGTRLNAGEYLVLSETHFNTNPGVDPSFTLSSHGEEVYLFSANAAGALTGYADGFDFGAAENGVSFGRHRKSTGEVDYPAQQAKSFGAANVGPRAGPVVINEVRYVGGASEQYIELKNVTATAVPLYAPDAPTNRWQLDGVSFEFPAQAALAAGGLALVTAADPRAFRAAHEIPGDVPVYGPWDGVLEVNGERLRLQRPDHADIETNGTVFLPYITVDVVRYNNRAPWPVADGAFALERINSRAYGNDPSNWRVRPDGSPGFENSGNRAPAVEAGPDLAWSATYFPVSTNLTARVMDDRLPEPPASVMLNWRQVSGPGAVVFSNQGSANPAVTFFGPGDYTLEVTGHDGELSSGDLLKVQISRTAPGDRVLVNWGEEWTYVDTGETLPENWMSLGYNDGAWPSGRAELGYGDDDEVTPLSFGPEPTAKHMTTYFRKRFSVTNAVEMQGLTLRLVRDDGAVVYLNGREVLRTNLPEGTILSTTAALVAIAGTDESTPVETALDPAGLREGSNVLAVEMHQVSAGSSDISFNAELFGPIELTNRAPVVNAGNDLKVRLPAPADLNGTATDDGVPRPGLLSSAWRVASGPGEIVFTPRTSLRCAAYFAKPGVYMLRLTVGDGALLAEDEVQITVEAETLSSWKQLYFTAEELANSSVSGSSADPDLDGKPNLDEYSAGTNPRDASSCFQLTALGWPEGEDASIAIRFMAGAGRVYSVQCRDALGREDWQKVRDIGPLAAPRPVEVQDQPSLSGTRFYRVVAAGP